MGQILKAVHENERIITHLCFNGIPTLFTKIHKIQYAALKVRQCRDALHLDRVHLL
jgi:hypothetical protein